MIRAKWLILAIATNLLVVACTSPKQVDFNCEIPAASSQPTQSQKLTIEMYVDGTPSMAGYVTHPTNAKTRYIDTIDLLDQILQTGWTPIPRTQPQVQYYRLGETIKNIDRKDYLLAKQSKFYNGTDTTKFPLLGVSRIETAIKPANDEKLTVIVTDLYQDGEDVIQLNKTILAQNYFNPNQPGYAVGILAVKSEFNGDVYLEDGSKRKFAYKTNDNQGNTIKGQEYRPFYVIFLGRYSDISDYFKKLTESNKIPGDNHLTIFSPSNLIGGVSYLPDLPKTEEGLQRLPNLTNDHVSLDRKDKTELLEIDKNYTKDLSVNYNVPFLPLSNTLPVDPDFIQTEVNIKTSSSSTPLQELPPDSPVQKALELNQWKIDNQSLNFTTTIKPSIFPQPEIYLFTVDAVAKKVQKESWWSDWNATSNTSQDWKTYNLQPFMEGLKNSTDNLMSNNKVVVGRFCFAIQKN
ncbi:hypothetical protein NIES2100_61710 [Calothrix sp. NIES-2100]|nr:hypothetical protein NIES2100_61710 [Calothrix sp. NIES-2100]